MRKEGSRIIFLKRRALGVISKSSSSSKKYLCYNSIMNKFSKIISGLTSPYLVIPVFSLVIIYHFADSLNQFFIWSILLIALSVIAPLLYILISVKQNKVTDLHVYLKEQREIPFLIAITGSILVLIIYYYLQVPRPLIAMMYALTINGTIFALLSRYWKLSMHAATFASSLTIVSMLVSSYWLILSPIIILIIWARLFRKRHTLFQLITASILSPIITAITILLLR